MLGPLRRYLRKQVGRPWDKVWSEITVTLDSRSLTTRRDGREVPIYGSAHDERAATKQASRKEIRDAQSLLWQDPLAE